MCASGKAGMLPLKGPFLGPLIIEQRDECCWSLGAVLAWKPGTNLARTGAREGMQAQIMAKSASIAVQMYESYIYPIHVY